MLNSIERMLFLYKQLNKMPINWHANSMILLANKYFANIIFYMGVLCPFKVVEMRKACQKT